jgi:hypothetical protein
MDNFMNTTSHTAFPGTAMENIVTIPANTGHTVSFGEILIDNLTSEDFLLAFTRAAVIVVGLTAIQATLRSKPVANLASSAYNAVADGLDWTWNGISSLWADSPEPASQPAAKSVANPSIEQVKASLALMPLDILEKLVAEKSQHKPVVTNGVGHA